MLFLNKISLPAPMVRNFSSTNVKKMDPITLNVIDPSVVQVNEAVLLICWLTIVAGSIHLIASGHWSEEFIRRWFPEAVAHASGSAAMAVGTDLIGILSRGSAALQVIMTETARSSGPELNRAFLMAIRGISLIIEGSHTAHEIFSNGVFDQVANWSRTFAIRAEGIAHLEYWSDLLEYTFWPAVRQSGDTIIAIIRNLEWELDLDPRFTPDLGWTEY